MNTIILTQAQPVRQVAAHIFLTTVQPSVLPQTIMDALFVHAQCHHLLVRRRPRVKQHQGPAARTVPLHQPTAMRLVSMRTVIDVFSVILYVTNSIDTVQAHSPIILVPLHQLQLPEVIFVFHSIQAVQELVLHLIATDALYALVQ